MSWPGLTRGPSAHGLSSVGIHAVQLNPSYQRLGAGGDAWMPGNKSGHDGIISERLFSDGSLVAVRTTFTGAHSGPFTFESHLSPTGKSLRAAEMFFCL